MSKLEINQLDLFSGIGGFHLGFERAGYKVNSYFSEIDKHAVAVYKQQFKDSTYVGSVTDVRGGDLPTIDLITFGSPCQDFSLAGKRKGMEGERSSLILEAIRLINECRPRAFVWENVKGTFSSNDGEDFAAILQAFANIGGYRLEWQLLNTSWFLPQNRERIYLVGYSTTPGGDWRGVFPIGAATKHIDEKVGNNTRKSSGRNPSHSRTLRKDIGSCGSGDTYIKVKSATSKGYEVATEGDSISIVQQSSTRRGRVGKGKAQTLATYCNQAVVEPMIASPKIYDGYNNNIKDDNIVGTITQHCSRNGMTNGFKVIEPNYRIRRLTPIECERLQGFPDNHTEYGNYDGEVKKMSNTQRYKQCGNAVTVDVVQAVAEQLKPIYNA